MTIHFMAATIKMRRYIPMAFPYMEDLEKYCPDGLHPVSINDVFADGRYKVLHKLGSGGFSTVWLVRDQTNSTLMSLKILTAALSAQTEQNIPDLQIPLFLEKNLRTANHSLARHLQTVTDHFTVQGPNGTHLCLISPLAGPSLRYMLHEADIRFPADLARKLAKQLADAIESMHSAGIAHGDLTPSNVLFAVDDIVRTWSDSELTQFLGEPEKWSVDPLDGSTPLPFAPEHVIEPADTSILSSMSLLQENVTIIDFGQSFFAKHPPDGYQPATVDQYMAPETRFESRVVIASDVWALACIIYEIRTGTPLFDDFLILMQLVELLGKFPDRWWTEYEMHDMWFEEETGEPKPVAVQRANGVSTIARKTSIREFLEDVGDEAFKTAMDDQETDLLEDLLLKMLRYEPEDRISMREVKEHPWFVYT